VLSIKHWLNNIRPYALAGVYQHQEYIDGKQIFQISADVTRKIVRFVDVNDILIRRRMK